MRKRKSLLDYQNELQEILANGSRQKSPDEMSVAELFGEDCPNDGATLYENGECPVCGIAPMVDQIERRRQWMKEHPEEEW